MEEGVNEKLIENFPLPVTIDGTIKILDQLKNSVCKIQIKEEKGTGFFCLINNNIKVMITNNHVINEKTLKENKKIKVSLNDNKEYKEIKLENKKYYTDEKYDTTIIEINEEDKIKNYIELDNIEDNDIYNRSVYILQYPKFGYEQIASVSYGIMKQCLEKYNIIHQCSTEYGSSGSPIINLSNNKVIGIHKQNVKIKNFNRGTLLKYPINEYLNKYKNNENGGGNEGNKNNEIIIKMNITQNEINKDIYFLNYDKNESDKKYKPYRDSIEYYSKLLNESKIEIIINNKKYENKRYFKPENEGKYTIKLIFKDKITTCAFMFYSCSNLTNIDLSSFDTTNVTNMADMFYSCSNLEKVNLSSLDTRNVTNMYYIFSQCSKLTNIDLSSFDTKNVNNMHGMFCYCYNLRNINLSSFDTKNTMNMNGMFYSCYNLTNLDLSSFDTTKVFDMGVIFKGCSNLKFVKIKNSNIKLKDEIIKNYNNIKIIE